MADHEIVNAWMLKALHDLDAARIINSHLPDYDDMVAFHCQQAIEKSLKGYLVFLEIEFKPVHDLGYLLNLIITKDETFDPLYDDIDRISRYAVQIRYPETVIKLSKNEITDAIQLAEKIFQLISERIAFSS
jgi:HEPN domain-containing protein